MNSWMNPSTSKICPLENTPKGIVLVLIKVNATYYTGIWNFQLVIILVWIVDISSCAIEEVADIVSASERPNVFRLTFPLTLARRSFRNSARCVRDWIELDVGGLIPWKRDIYYIYAAAYNHEGYSWLRSYFPIRSHTLQIIASKVFQNSRRTSAHMTTTRNTSLACINEDIETPTLKAKTWEKGYILDDCWSKRFPARVCFRNLPLLPGGPHACRLSIGSHRWPSRVQLSLPTSHRIGRSHWPLASNSWHPPCKNVVLGVGSGVAAGIVPPKIWEIYDSHSSMFESVFKTCMVAVFGALPVGY